ncbi:MAG: hypothetical protein IPJ04_16345 [Candidatus Eisenbacteria bacterium]|nr:hypothetical protein [Candidatus Eisenbacteria bacterium]
MNVITCAPRSMSPAMIWQPSTFELRRSTIVSSRYGGFQNTKCFAPRGEPSSSTTATSRPVSSPASSPGLRMVALQST